MNFIGGPDIGIEPFLLLIIPSSMVKESCNVLHLDDLIEEDLDAGEIEPIDNN